MFAQSMTRPNFGNFTVVWLGEIPDVAKLDDSQSQRLMNSLHTFNNTKKCVNYIRYADKESLSLVISNSPPDKILPHVHRFPQLISIYIVSLNAPSPSEKYSTTYPKVKGVFSDVFALSKHIVKEIRATETITTPISILSSNVTSSKDLNTLDPSFMYSQLLKEILFEFDYKEEDRRQLAEFCRKHYAADGSELHVIDEFDHSYQTHSPAWWYTRECFLYKMLNKALRIHDIDILCKMGFFARDLHEQLKELHNDTKTGTPLILYRGQGMFNDEFKKLKKNMGNLLSFNNLLSTSTNRDISLDFAQYSLGKEDTAAVLFEIHIDPATQSTPFASLDGISYFPTEAETLFSMHSIFRIGKIEQMPNGIWSIQLTLTSDDDPQLRELTDFMRLEIRGPNAMHRLASYMLKMCQWDKAEEIYHVLLRQTPSEEKHELAFIEHNLGMVCDQKGDLERASTHFKKSLDIEKTYLPDDHPQLAPTYSSLACLYEKQGKFDLAMKHYELALTIELKSPFPDMEKIAIRYMNMGDLFRQRGHLSKARKSVEDALKIRIDILPSIHPSLATTHSHLVDICYLMGDYSTSLEHAKEELRIVEKCYPAKDMSIALAHNHVSAALDKLRRYKEALNEAEKAVEIGQHTYPLGHPEMRVYENSLNVLRRITKLDHV